MSSFLSAFSLSHALLSQKTQRFSCALFSSIACRYTSSSFSFPLSPLVSAPQTPLSLSFLLLLSPSLIPLVETLIHALEKIAELKIPLLICADLNSLPQSDPYTFISKARVEILPTKETDKSGILQTLKLSHPLNLVSAYATFFQSDGVEDHQREKMDPETKEPLFTSRTPSFFGTLDYIFYTAASLRLDSVLELLDKDLDKEGYLPSAKWSSDHIALMASFSLETSAYNLSSEPLPESLGQHPTFLHNSKVLQES